MATDKKAYREEYLKKITQLYNRTTVSDDGTINSIRQNGFPGYKVYLGLTKNCRETPTRIATYRLDFDADRMTEPVVSALLLAVVKPMV